MKCPCFRLNFRSMVFFITWILAEKKSISLFRSNDCIMFFSVNVFLCTSSLWTRFRGSTRVFFFWRFILYMFTFYLLSFSLNHNQHVFLNKFYSGMNTKSVDRIFFMWVQCLWNLFLSDEISYRLQTYIVW